MKKRKQKFVGSFIPPEDFTGHYFLGDGNVALTILIPDGNWESLLPIVEHQDIRDIETYNCTGFGSTNQIELVMLQLTGLKFNYSDRWVGIIAGTKEPGNDPHVVYEAIRKNGLIPEEMLPFSDDIKNVDEYYSFKGADEEACRKAGKEWLAKYEFKHDWVFTPGQPPIEQMNNIKVALKNSPICLAVYAWASDSRGVYISMGEPNHWTTCYNASDFLKIFDTYDPTKKNVEQIIAFCKRISITLKKNDPITPEQALGFWQQIKNLWNLVFNIKKQIDALPKQPPISLPEPLKSTEVPIAIQKYAWGAKDLVRHSIRVIADEEGLTVLQKDLACDIALCESGFDTHAIRVNSPRSVDRGLFQWNDKYHPEITDEIAFNPEKNARLACLAIKMGKAHIYWSASEYCWNKTGKYNSLVS